MKRCLFLYNSMSPFSRKKVYGGEKQDGGKQHGSSPVFAPPGLHGALDVINAPPEAPVCPPADPPEPPAQTPEQAPLERDRERSKPPGAERTIHHHLETPEQHQEPFEHGLDPVHVPCVPEGHRVLV